LFDHTDLSFERQPNIFRKKNEKKIEKKFFLPENSARSQAATKKWSFECLGVKGVTLWTICLVRNNKVFNQLLCNNEKIHAHIQRGIIDYACVPWKQ